MRDHTNPDTAIRVVDKADVKSWPSYDMEAARASTVPSDVSFRLDGPPVKQDGIVLLHGLLENAGSTTATVTVFAAHGAAGPFGFFIEPAASCARHKPLPPGPPLPMQAPPPPLVIELPARTAVRVWRSLLLDDYDWIPGAPIDLEWCFQFWNEPRPRGTVRLS